MEQTLTFEELDQLLGEQAPFLSSLSDGPDNELQVVISAAIVGEVGTGIRPEVTGALRDILSECRPITPNSNAMYEIFFENYILYQTRNESFTSYAPEEIRSGNFLITFESSRLLDSIPLFSDAFHSDDGTYYPGPWKHYGIYTQNHIIDVISHCPPSVTLIQGK
jgi:hypothetical protein